MFINRALTGSIAALAIAFSSMTAVADPAASLALPMLISAVPSPFTTTLEPVVPTASVKLPEAGA